jgi:hypothetical protein
MAMGLGIQSYFHVKDLILPCGAANMLIGLVLLVIVLRREQARLAFYGEGEEGGLALAILVAGIPAMTLAVGLIWWLMSKLLAS